MHVDGVPHSGLGFWHAPGESGTTEWREFARCGVHFFQLDLSCWAEDSAAWDQALEATVQADPEARIWLRVSTTPPQAWLDAHPDHVQVHHDENNGDVIRKFVAFGGALWRKRAAEHLARLVDYMEARYADRVWAYNIQSGDCGEWAYSWSPVLSGYAPAQVAGWREWLGERYADATELRKAWGDPDAQFATAEPPAWTDRTRASTWPPASHLIDPARERRLVDWLAFHGTAQATALAELAGAVRKALDERGRRKLVSAFHGYHLWPYGAAYGPCNTGFSDLDPVLTSPDIDALCTPLGYIHRNPGGLYCHHNLAATIRLHGKLFYTEDDTFTHHAGWTPWRYCCRDAAETVNILRRNLAGVLCEGATQWWMDHNGENWYVDDETEAGLAGMVRLAETALSRDRSSCAEVAFVTNEASFRILRQAPELIDQLWPKTQTELLRIGAPVDFVRVRDLALAAANGDTARWKLVVVAGCLWLEPAERELLRRTLLRDGRHVLFLHAQGICDGMRSDLALASEFVGINLAQYPHGGPCRGETMLEGRHLSWGTDKEVAPILYAEDEDAEILGWLERQYCPVFVRKPQNGWTALWSGVPGLPWQLMGRLAEQAGIHRFLEDGSQVMANAGLLAVHPAGDGEQTLHLPCTERLVDAIDGGRSDLTEAVALALRRGQTRIWLREGMRQEWRTTVTAGGHSCPLEGSRHAEQAHVRPRLHPRGLLHDHARDRRAACALRGVPGQPRPALVRGRGGAAALAGDSGASPLHRDQHPRRDA